MQQRILYDWDSITILCSNLRYMPAVSNSNVALQFFRGRFVVRVSRCRFRMSATAVPLLANVAA